MESEIFRKRAITLFVLIFAFIDKVDACSCGEWHSFTNLMGSKDIVSVVTINQYLTFKDIGGGFMMPMSMEVVVETFVKGNEVRDTIVIWGDNGMLCAPYVEKFPLGSRWMFALNYIDDPSNYGHDSSKIGDYFVGGCGDVYLNIIDSNAVGYIFEEENIQSVPEQTFLLADLIDIIQGTTDVLEVTNSKFDECELSQNYPNPFNPTTTIKYTIPAVNRNAVSMKNNSRFGESHYNTTLIVYDMLGREVATLVDEYQKPGYYEVKIDGSKLASGVYVYRITLGEFTSVKKLMLMK